MLRLLSWFITFVGEPMRSNLPATPTKAKGKGEGNTNKGDNTNKGERATPTRARTTIGILLIMGNI
ncbi:MAG: hypothetical protein ACKOEV_14395 [Cytophagales bacterium]